MGATGDGAVAAYTVVESLPGVRLKDDLDEEITVRWTGDRRDGTPTCRLYEGPSNQLPTRELTGEPAAIPSTLDRCPREDDEPWRVPDRVGRFTIVDTLGKGGMGVVYSAFDPKLDRKVAIKILGSQAVEGSSGRARMIREAQALARLSHPNVVQIYEVGEVGSRIFMAMELVGGSTLRSWARETPRAWREVVEVMRGAGTGLVAAHESGLVHRDFKPGNVIVGEDGRVRVLDFGIACVDLELLISSEDQSASRTSGSWSEMLTQKGAIVGTPAYMSPEQHMGGHVDARSDQFSFCVTLYECLYGQRPFLGRSQAELATAVLEGRVPPPPRGTRVPAWLHRIIARGLEIDPDLRWPTMAALLSALDREPTRARRRIGAAAVVAGLIGLGGYGLARADTQTAAACANAEDHLAGVWDEEQAQRVESAFMATELPYARDSWTRARDQLDAYARDWVAMRTETCEATHVNQEQSPELLDLRMSCLDRRLQTMGAMVDVLADANPDAVRRAVRGTATLESLDRCADAEALRDELPPPEDPQLAAYVTDARARLAGAMATRLAGQYDEALAVAREVAADERTARYRPLTAEVSLVVGQLADDAGSPAEAETLLLDAYYTAEAIGHDAVILKSATALTDVVGHGLARHEEGLAWSRHAEAVSERLGRNGLRTGTHLLFRGLILERMGKFEDARSIYEDVLELRVARYGSDHVQTAAALGMLGNANARLGDYERAEALQRRALRIEQEALGPRHPHLMSILNNLGIALKHRGKYEDAAQTLEEAVVLSEEVLGATHPTTAAMLVNLGLVYRRLGDYPKAERTFWRGAEAAEASLGPEHPHIQAALANIGDVLERQGRREEAVEIHARSLKLAEQIFGTDHYRVGVVLSNYGRTLIGLERLDEAQAMYERSLQIAEAAHGKHHRNVVSQLVGLAEISLRRDEPDAARAGLERALAIVESTETPGHEQARVRFALARTLHAQGEDAPRALALASAAGADYRESGAGYASDHAQVVAWLEALER